MVIPSELPRFVAATRPVALQALALQAGTVVDAKVIGPVANGGTQVEIRGQVLNLVLPTLLKAGETIRLEVHGAGQNIRLALPAAAPLPQAPASPAPAAPAPDVSLPLPNPITNATPVPPQAGAPTAATQVVQGQPAIPLQQTATADARPSQTTAQPAAVAPNPPAGASVTPAAAGPQPANPSPTNALPTSPSAPTAAGSPPPAGQAASTTAATTTVITTSVPPPVPASIYPQTNAALPNPLAVAAAATAATLPAPAAQTTSSAVRPVVPVIAVDAATMHSPSGNPLPQPPPQPATPQAALAQMVHTAIPNQGPVTALTAALTSISGQVVLPEPVARAAQQVLAGRVAIDAPRFNGASLQAAIRGSGIFQEATLAHGQAALPQADMKSALLTLRSTLTNWLGQQAPVAAVAQVPPPLRGTIPRARAAEAPPIDPDTAPEAIGKQLLERTESALARVRLHQHASLPDPVSKTADWSMDLPVMVGAQQTLLHIHIHGDQQGESEAANERGWQMRFALSLPEMGEVGAQVTLRAGATGVMLWATEPTVSAALEAEIDALRESLGNAGLRPGAVIVRHGEPPAPTTAAPSGHFVDARS